jgi:Reverse transcriptase (RNA-dependent DNA polymerase)
MPQLLAKVSEWEADGFIERLAVQPLCCNPLTVAVQHIAETGVTKYRPCIDLSRHVNAHIADFPVKIDDLSVAQELIEQGDFMVALDLENQFFQVRLHPDTKKYFGFSVPGPDGSPLYYQFTVMAYGCKPAVAVVTRLLKPIKSHLHRLGIKFSIYVDDGRISASCRVTCRLHLLYTIHILQLAGWRIQWKKTVLVPTTRLLHLGFITDSVTMRYFITPEKRAAVSSALRSVLDTVAAATPLPVKQLASLIGKITALHRSHGNIVRIMTRALQHCLGRHVSTYGWVGVLVLDAACVDELQFLYHSLPEFDGHFIPSGSTVQRVSSLENVQQYVEAIQHTARPLPSLYVSDASDTHAFVYLADGTFAYVQDFPFEADAVQASSTYRELLAIHMALTENPDQFTSSAPTLIYWQTDSEAVSKCLTHGSRQVSCYYFFVFNISCSPVFFLATYSEAGCGHQEVGENSANPHFSSVVSARSTAAAMGRQRLEIFEEY